MNKFISYILEGNGSEARTVLMTRLNELVKQKLEQVRTQYKPIPETTPGA